MSFRRAIPHLGVAAGFAALAVALTWPLAIQLSTHLPGTGPGDDVTFVWNFWWMRQALDSDALSFFHTNYLLHPTGVDLTLHTHTALNALVGATVLRSWSPIAAQNLVIVASYALNGFAAYWLAWSLTSHRSAAIAAGVFFAASPYFAGHFPGHFNLLSAWGLPLFAATLLQALQRQSVLRAAAAGVVLGLVIYLDYYYVVFLAAFTACALAARALSFTLEWRSPTRRQTPLDYALAAIALLAFVVVAGVALTGGTVLSIGPWHLSVRSGTNVRAIGTAALLFWSWRRWGPVLRLVRGDAAQFARDLRVIGATAAASVLTALPVLWNAARLWDDGGYVSQRYLWRSAPGGVDLASFVAGNPFHPLWGGAIGRFYAAAGVDPVEATAWLGLAPVAFLVWTRRAWTRVPDAMPWIVAASVFLVWSLGPRLTAFGFNTGLPLPEILLRFVPIVSNARIPGRAIVMVYLACAALLAIAIVTWRAGRSRGLAGLLIGLTLLDFAAMPMPTYRVERASLFDGLAGLPAGGVLPLPLGLRDGFGEEGRWDGRVLLQQSVHGKPMAGGFVARLPDAIKTAYRESPVLGTLLRLSADRVDDWTLADRDAVAAFLSDHHVRYVVIDTATAPPALREYVATHFPLTLVISEPPRELYEVQP